MVRWKLVLSIALVVVLWAWSSLWFIPAITGNDSPVYALVSIGMTLIIGLALVLSCYWLTLTPSRYLQHWPTLANAALIFSGVVALPIYLYLVHNGSVGGLGGARGDAIDLAVTRLQDGLYPYSVNVGSDPLTPMPGGLLLAAPAVLLFGSAGYATLYLIPIAAWILHRADRLAAGVAALALVLAPAYWTDILSNGDLVVTSFLAFAVGLCVLLSSRRPTSIASWLWPVLLGVVGATRITTMMVAVLVAALVVNSGKFWVAVRQLSVALGTFLALSLPFYFWDSEHFSPLHVRRFTQNSLGAGLVLVFSIALIVILMRSKKVKYSTPAVQVAFAVSVFGFGVTLLPMIASMSLRASTGELLLGYGVLALTAPVMIISERFKPNTGIIQD